MPMPRYPWSSSLCGKPIIPANDSDHWSSLEPRDLDREVREYMTDEEIDLMLADRWLGGQP